MRRRQHAGAGAGAGAGSGDGAAVRRREGLLVAAQQQLGHLGRRAQHVGQHVRPRLAGAAGDPVRQEAGREDVRRHRDPADTLRRAGRGPRPAVRGREAEANAGRTAHQPVRRHSRAISAITALASGSEEPAEASTTPVDERSPGRSPASYSRRSRAAVSSDDGPSTPAVLSRSDGSPAVDSRSTAGMSVLAWKARVSSSGSATACRTPSAASRCTACGTEGAQKSRNAVSTRSPGRAAATRAVSARTDAACRGSRRAVRDDQQRGGGARPAAGAGRRGVDGAAHGHWLPAVRPRLRSTQRSSGLKMIWSMAMPTNRISRMPRKTPAMSEPSRMFSR